MNSNGYFANGAPVAPNAARERRCPTCGTPADPDAAFCGECGAAIKWEDAANLNVTASGDDVGENALVSEAGADATVGPSFLGVFAYGLKHCFDFKGRATRMEFFAAGVLFAVPGAIAAAIAAICCMSAENKPEFISVAICLFGAAAALGCAWLATSVRRFHDIGRSAKLWIALLLLVGIANLLALTLRLDPYTRAFACYEELFAWILGIPFGVLTTTAQLKKGTPGPNRYGPRRLNPSVAVPYDGEVTVGPSYRGAFWYCMKNYCTFKGRATRTEYWGGERPRFGDSTRAYTVFRRRRFTRRRGGSVYRRGRRGVYGDFPDAEFGGRRSARARLGNERGTVLSFWRGLLGAFLGGNVGD